MEEHGIILKGHALGQIRNGATMICPFWGAHQEY